MIPDFFDLRSELEEEVLLYLHMKERSGPILGEVRSRTQHEGRSHSYVQTGFGVVEGAPKEFSSTIQFSPEELVSLRDEALISKLDELAEETRGKLSRELFDAVARETEKAGTSIDAEGRPLTGEMILEMMRRTEMDFDRNKQPKQKFYVHPEMAKVLQVKAKEWEADQELQKRNRQLLNDKYEEFRVRESRRKLVS